MTDHDDDTPATEQKAPARGERIAKVMSRSGVASRREAERMILEGRVTVNGRVIDTPALDVTPADRVFVDGKPMEAPQETRLWLYYKPVGIVTTDSDEKGRQTIQDALPRDLPRVMTVGRLDLSSEGLLLLTNDGALKRVLELPATGWLRRYRVRVNGTPNDLTLAPLKRGITIDGEEFAPMEVTIDSSRGANSWLTVGIREGRNREIRRAMAHVGLTVNRLIRIGYGPFKLADMEKNEVREVKRRVMREQLGGLLPGAAPAEEAKPADAPRKPRAPRRGGEGAAPRPFPREGGEGTRSAPRTGGPRRAGSGGDDARPSREPRKQGFSSSRGDGQGPSRPRRDEAFPGAGAGSGGPRKPFQRDKGGERPASSPRPAGEGRPERAARPPRPAGDARPERPARAPRAPGDGRNDRSARKASGAQGAAERTGRPPRGEQAKRATPGQGAGSGGEGRGGYEKRPPHEGARSGSGPRTGSPSDQPRKDSGRPAGPFKGKPPSRGGDYGGNARPGKPRSPAPGGGGGRPPRGPGGKPPSRPR